MVLIMHHPTNGKPALFVASCPRDMTDATTRKNAKATITCLKKQNKIGSLSICVRMLLKYIKIHIEIQTIERGTAVMPFVLVAFQILV